MFVVKIDYKTGQSYAFIFNTDDGANDAVASLLEAKSGARVPLQDDLGHRANILINGDIVGIMTTDLIKETVGGQQLAQLMRAMRPPQPAPTPATDALRPADVRWADSSEPVSVLAPMGHAVDTSGVDPRFAGVPGRPQNPPFAS